MTATLGWNPHTKDYGPAKVCRKCGVHKPSSEFYPTRATCKICVDKRVGVYVATPAGNAARYRAQHGYRLRSYGSSLDEYGRLLESQGGVCAICKRPESRRDRGGKIKRLGMDHDHATGKPRALLCDKCNNMLGRAEDDPGRLIAAAAYLMEHQNG